MKVSTKHHFGQCFLCQRDSNMTLAPDWAGDLQYKCFDCGAMNSRQRIDDNRDNAGNVCREATERNS